ELASHQRCRVCGGVGRSAGRFGRDLQCPWGRQVGLGRSESAAAACDRCHLSASHQSAYEVNRDYTQGYDLILIGHAGHPEVIGTLGQIPDKFHLVSSLADVEKLQVDNV